MENSSGWCLSFFLSFLVNLLGWCAIHDNFMCLEHITIVVCIRWSTTLKDSCRIELENYSSGLQV